jgi:hypothetical protein
MKSVQLLAEAPVEAPVRMAPRTTTEVPDETCPRCHWTCAEPSGRRTVLDQLMLLIQMKPFRCRACFKNFYRFSA